MRARKLFHNFHYQLSRDEVIVAIFIIYDETNYSWNVHSEGSYLLGFHK